ncbi:MAG: cytochrome c oxidase subunit II [Asticcacaulis sp.]
MGIGKLFAGRLFKTAASVATALAGAAFSAAAFAQDKVGQPTDKAMGWQPAATSLKVHTESFYSMLFWIITAISLFVLVLLIWIVIRYNKRANPVPAKFSHNTLIEIIWTAVPVAILVFIAVYSLSLLKEYNDMPTPDVVVKATGNQWYWTYDYPELGVTGIDSKLRDDAKDITKAHAAGIPYLLETDNQLVIPVNRVVHIETTASDVIHSWTVPAFGPKIDAIPGRLNNGWFRVDKIGTYYGQCSELCGQDHAYMPIEVKVVSDADFDAYIIAQGGKTKAMLAADAASAAAASQAAAATQSSASDASAEATASGAASAAAQ